MKNMKVWALALLLCSGSMANAQNWEHTQEDRKVAVEIDTLKKNGYSLIWINKDKDFNPALKQRLIDTYFLNYPKLAKTYNANTIKEVTFVIDPEYKGVAATAGGIVRYNPGWFAKNPGDVDVVTHEVMHIVQGYPDGSGPWWVTEGVADYARFVFGVDNPGAKWTLPELKPDQTYSDGYRITARFLFWIDKKVKKDFVKNLDSAMRNKTYTNEFWKNQTGLTVSELWEKYSANPKI